MKQVCVSVLVGALSLGRRTSGGAGQHHRHHRRNGDGQHRCACCRAPPSACWTRARARQKTTVTNGDGAFAFRDLNFGTYQVTVKLPGFQSAVYNKVIVEAGRTTDLRVRLAVGGLEREHHGRGQVAGPRNDHPTSFPAR